jgi:uncharacterized membrane protein
MTDPPQIERDMAHAVHLATAYWTFLYLPIFFLTGLLRLLPDAPERPFYRHHVAQATRLHLAFAIVSVVTCGVGFVVLSIPVYLASLRAAEAARRGEWYLAPLVGKLGAKEPPGVG